MGLTPEQFIRKWADTHTELGIQDAFAPKNAIGKHPSDKGIDKRKKIPGKKIIEKKCAEERSDKLLECLHDAVEVTASQLVELNPLQIIDRIVKLDPPSQRIQQDVNTNFTFADMVHKASLEVENFRTTDTTAEEADTEDEDVPTD